MKGFLKPRQSCCLKSSIQTISLHLSVVTTPNHLAWLLSFKCNKFWENQPNYYLSKCVMFSHTCRMGHLTIWYFLNTNPMFTWILFTKSKFGITSCKVTSQSVIWYPWFIADGHCILGLSLAIQTNEKLFSHKTRYLHVTGISTVTGICDSFSVWPVLSFAFRILKHKHLKMIILRLHIVPKCAKRRKEASTTLLEHGCCPHEAVSQPSTTTRSDNYKAKLSSPSKQGN